MQLACSSELQALRLPKIITLQLWRLENKGRVIASLSKVLYYFTVTE